MSRFGDVMPRRRPNKRFADARRSLLEKVSVLPGRDAYFHSCCRLLRSISPKTLSDLLAFPLGVCSTRTPRVDAGTLPRGVNLSVHQSARRVTHLGPRHCLAALVLTSKKFAPLRHNFHQAWRFPMFRSFSACRATEASE
jgi:hypothetical protein